MTNRKTLSSSFDPNLTSPCSPSSTHASLSTNVTSPVRFTSKKVYSLVPYISVLPDADVFGNMKGSTRIVFRRSERWVMGSAACRLFLGCIFEVIFDKLLGVCGM